MSNASRRFESYAAATEANARGLGLRLYITEQIVAGHGDAIRVDASPDHGTTFIVELPRTGARAVPDPLVTEPQQGTGTIIVR